MHGNLHTVSSINAVCCITVIPGNRFLCSVCKANPKAVDGSRVTGDAHCDTFHHMGSRLHFGAHRTSMHGMNFDEKAWTEFTMGNKRGGCQEWRHGLSR